AIPARLRALFDAQWSYDEFVRLTPLGPESEGQAYAYSTTGQVAGDALSGSLELAQYPRVRTDDVLLPDMHGLVQTERGEQGGGVRVAGDRRAGAAADQPLDALLDGCAGAGLAQFNAGLRRRALRSRRDRALSLFRSHARRGRRRRSRRCARTRAAWDGALGVPGVRGGAAVRGPRGRRVRDERRDSRRWAAGRRLARLALPLVLARRPLSDRRARRDS